MAGHSVSPWPRQLNEALLKPVLVLWLSWGNEMKALWWKNTTSNILWRAQLSIAVFSGDKVARYCFSRLVHTCSIERCTKPLLGLYLVLRGSSYQKQKLKVKVWWLCTGIATFWRLYCYHWPRNLEKHQKRRHFEVASLLGLEHLRYGQKEFIASTGGSQKALSTGIA